MRRIFAFLLLVAVLVGPTLVARAAGRHGQHRDVRQVVLKIRGHFPCVEDEVLIGVGQYENNRWTAWKCINGEDLYGLRD